VNGQGADHVMPGIQVVDLGTVTPAELEDLWQHEIRWWRDCLLWDVSDSFAALRRLVARGGLPGKAVRLDSRIVGYASYGVAEHLGVISSVVVSPGSGAPEVTETLVQETVDEMRRQGVRRIESQCLTGNGPSLVPAFTRAGLRTYWHDFLRRAVRSPRGSVHPSPMVSLEPWGGNHLEEAAAILQAAYTGGVEAEIHERYRSAAGCRMVLEQLIDQGSCGPLVAEASLLARHRGQAVGCVVVNETAPRQAHLPQVAVLPEYQRCGIGRWLLDDSLSQLAASQFETLSLIVSRANERARKIYQAMGFHPVLAFPAFVWER
jgi:ribosomal protein S18 acetylase RimI-like enzyme